MFAANGIGEKALLAEVPVSLRILIVSGGVASSGNDMSTAESESLINVGVEGEDGPDGPD